MTAEQTRDQLVDALRRDLLGPLADPDGHYPAAVPVTLAPGHALAAVRDLSHLYVAPDGYEVLTGESPVGRYVTGALYPTLGAHDDTDIDVAQAPNVGEVPETEPAAVVPAVAPAVDDDTLEAATDEDLDATATTVDRVGRPSSMGISFVIDADVTTLEVHVHGARYESYDLTVAGRPQQGWHRIPVTDTRTVDLPTQPGRVTRDLAEGPLHAQVGVDVRASANGTRVVTAYLVNRTPRGTGPLAPLVLFTAALTVTIPAGHLRDYPEPDVDTSPEARTLRLLYTTAPVRAVGHGCDAVVDDGPAGHVVRTETFPVARVAPTTPDISDEAGSLAVDMDDLGEWKASARAVVDRTLTAYRAWIATRRAKAATLSGEAAATAAEHLAACEAFAGDIEAGWKLAQTGTVHIALRYASLAMATQRRSYSAKTRPVTFNKATKTFTVAPAAAATGKRPAWRPFQLAFILANLPPQTDPAHPRRGAVDVIWMPTGGGKTEAYLGLAAFTMLHRRLLDPSAKGTTVLMRYTLRLLTAQQLQRAASLICALNDLREDGRTGELGKARFSIGAWLGKASTPNTRKDAQAMLTALGKGTRGTRKRPFLLSRCPSCATSMGDTHDGKVAGYDIAPVPNDPTKNRMRAICPNPACAYSKGAGLPVFEVDEDVYAAQPTFVVATVDKFAQLAWNDKPRTLFGIGPDGTRRLPAPELIIQDELHLISGPLGSLVGLYESTIDQLCRYDDGTAPRIVAATATTRAYGRQAQHLYACPAEDVRLVPPPGLSADDSFFAKVNPDVAPRMHIGVCATGVSRFQHTEMRVLSSLTHAAAAIEQADSTADLNPYWTNVVFFGSLRDLGHAKSLLATDARSYAWRLHRSTGVNSGNPRADGTRAAVRHQHDVELTSAASADAAVNLDKLTKAKGEAGCVDLALATSVIEVGVDVDRLGLLTMIRQPKTASQYIQVAGRVGRDATNGPGVVVTVLNPANSRDMSHYERFTSTHARLYAAVEPASVTPFTGAALTRGLRGALASTVRQIRPVTSPAVTDADLDLLDTVTDAVRARLSTLPHTSTDVFDEVAAYARAQATSANGLALAWGTPFSPAFLRPPEAPAPVDMPSWSVLMSLRSVDGDAAVHLDDQALPARATQPAAPVTGEEDDAW
ncbi:helicase-related protein [Cellulomonas sp. HD19AZ1]|uniref:helicase-related protein n=1 Tax=Cellulomonas sp. HD19AZ1 TaxID=2559593 RepID=UPI001070C227|nr:helicase-related protein [Cellulomonas sp. HD19AZ1]TFH74078.1 hypothetical protein E4A51_01015 [Cellulomonas sp. HD19AZ1]